MADDEKPAVVGKAEKRRDRTDSMQKRRSPLNIAQLQRDIEELYGLGQGLAIDQFLISSQELKEVASDSSRLAPQVLLKEENGVVLFAVHVGDEILDRFEAGEIEESDLSDFVSVAEEVSHFRYLTWSAANERSVSLLDVEVQGEIDKFLLAVRYFPEEEDLRERMFERISFDEHLGGDDLDRYIEANRLGEKFCRQIEEAIGDGQIDPKWVARLRAFYRLATTRRLAEVEKL